MLSFPIKTKIAFLIYEDRTEKITCPLFLVFFLHPLFQVFIYRSVRQHVVGRYVPLGLESLLSHTSLSAIPAILLNPGNIQLALIILPLHS